MISKNVCIRLGQNFKRLRGLNQCPQVRSAHEVAGLFTELCELDREVMAAAVLDCKCRMICWELVAVGSANQVMLRQGDVFHAAIANRGSGLIVVHNHPSGDPTPSRYDLTLTRKLERMGRQLGIPLLDHVIVARGGYKSLVSSESGYSMPKLPPTRLQRAAENRNVRLFVRR